MRFRHIRNSSRKPAKASVPPRNLPLILGVEDTIASHEMFLPPTYTKRPLADYCAHVDALVREGLGNLYVVRGCVLHPKATVNFQETHKCIMDDPDGDMVKLLGYAAQKGLYVMTLYTEMTRRVVAELKRRCGKYYLGNDLGEVTGHMPPESKDMRQAAKAWVKHIRGLVDRCYKLGQPHVTCTTNNALAKYTAAAGMDIPMAEIFGNSMGVDVLYAQLRGTARAYQRKLFGGWIAAGWYAGGNFDPLKPGRRQLAYYSGFLNGANIFVNESGHWGLHEFYTPQVEDETHPICRKTRKILSDFYQYAGKHPRPRQGPEVNIGIVHGIYDGYTGGETIWGQSGWLPNSHDRSWELLKIFFPEVGDVGDALSFQDRRYSRFSGNPYGLVDIVPGEASASTLARYRSLLFLGWNTMTDRQYRNLVQYVRGGGRLVMWAPHLNGSVKHNQVSESQKFFRHGDFRDLFGVRIRMPRRLPTGIYSSSHSVVNTVKWIRSGAYRFPVGKQYYFNWPHGGVESELKPGVRTLAVTDHGDPFVTEYPLGKGKAVLVHCFSPQGNGDFRELAEDIFHAVGRRERSSFYVEGSPRLSYAVFGNGKQRTLYVLNTSLEKTERGVVQGLSRGPDEIRLGPTEIADISWQ